MTDAISSLPIFREFGLIPGVSALFALSHWPGSVNSCDIIAAINDIPSEHLALQ